MASIKGFKREIDHQMGSFYWECALLATACDESKYDSIITIYEAASARVLGVCTGLRKGSKGEDCRAYFRGVRSEVDAALKEGREKLQALL